MEFLSPLYSYQSEGDTFGDVHVHVSHLTSENMEHVLEPQDSIPNKLQLVTSMCRILQVKKTDMFLHVHLHVYAHVASV